MQRRYFIFVLIAIFTIITGCKKCLNCDCTKNGQKFIEEECATGINQENGLEYWQKDMMEEKDYEDCLCSYD